jgi:hypothetical protein
VSLSRAALIGLAGCAARAPAPRPPAEAEVRAAVAAATDAELQAWLPPAGGYALRATRHLRLAHHRLYLLFPEDGPVGASVYLAVPERGAPMVTTGEPVALATVLAAEPELGQGEALLAAAFELLRVQERHQLLVPGSGAVEPRGAGLRLSFEVDPQGGARQRWNLTLDGDESALRVGAAGRWATRAGGP